MERVEEQTSRDFFSEQQGDISSTYHQLPKCEQKYWIDLSKSWIAQRIEMFGHEAVKQSLKYTKTRANEAAVVNEDDSPETTGTATELDSHTNIISTSPWRHGSGKDMSEIGPSGTNTELSR